MSRPVIAFVGCGKQKSQAAAPAKDFYRSELFRRSRRYAEAVADRWFILSALHGVVEPHQVLEPYDVKLTKQAVPDWRHKVTNQFIRARLNLPDFNVIMLAGGLYYDAFPSFLQPHSYDCPLQGLGIGRRLQELERLARETTPIRRCSHCGCTERWGCTPVDGRSCWWVSPDLCSRCADMVGAGNPSHLRLEVI